MRFIYGKNVFITGASSGIGLSAAELLAGAGYTVYAASRHPVDTVRRYESGGSIIPVELDVCNPDSVAGAAESVLTQADIGIIVHCAGIGISLDGEADPAGAAERLMDTNYTGVLRVNSRFLPHLRRRGGGLCIVIGSVAGVFPIPFQSHYSASKAALEAYLKALRIELRPFGVRACLVMPGDTSTGFTHSRRRLTGEDSPYFKACTIATDKMEHDEINGKPPSSVAGVILKLCEKKSPPVRTTVGFDYKLLVFLKRLLPERFVELALRKMYRQL